MREYRTNRTFRSNRNRTAPSISTGGQTGVFSPPTSNNYVTEDGLDNYVTEDGLNNYVTEM